ncbi:hypothetical protein OT109_15530 [Phycisphaeraceae bacterium D3-23]
MPSPTTRSRWSPRPGRAREIEDARGKLADPDLYMRFPLFNRPERGPNDVIDPDDLDEALAAISILRANAASAGNQADTIGAGAQVQGYDEINELLRRLRGGGRISAAQRERLDRLAQIGAALSGEGLEVEVWIPGEAFLNDNVPPGAEGMAPANRRFTHVDVPDNQQDLSTQGNANQKAFTLTIPGNDTFELGFYYEGGAGVAANRVPYSRSGLWSAIDAILPTGDEADVVVDDDDVYWVPILIQDRNANQTQRYYWIGLKFKRPLPSPTDWPTSEAP